MVAEKEIEGLIIPTRVEGLTLRQLQLEDATALFELIASNREHLSQHQEPTSLHYPDLSSAIRSITHPRNPSKIRFGIWNADYLMGSVNIRPVTDKDAEIGYWLGQSFCGRGFALVAVQAIYEYAFQNDYTAVLARVYHTNTPSQKVLLRSGFSVVGSQDDYLIYRRQKLNAGN